MTNPVPTALTTLLSEKWETANLLLVEDHDQHALLIADELATIQGIQINCERVKTLAAAQQKLAQERFDILLLDLSLPDSSVDNTLTLVPTLALGRAVILLTANADEEKALAALRQGAQDYLIKGQFDVPLLRRAVRYAYERQYALTNSSAAIQADPAAPKTTAASDGLEIASQLRAVAENSTDAIVALDNQGNIAYINPTAITMFGYSEADTLGRSVFDMLPLEIHVEAAHLMRDYMKRGKESGLTTAQFPVICKDGSAILVELSVSQLEHVGECPCQFVGFMRDVTARKQQEERLRRETERPRLLAAIDNELADVKLDYQAVIDTLANYISQIIGDGCSISLLAEDKATLLPVAYYHRDPEAARLMRQLNTSSPGDLEPPRVFNSPEVTFAPVVNQDFLFAMGDRHYMPFFEKVGINSMMIVPMLIGGQRIGQIIVTRDQLGNPYTTEDLAFLQQLAERAAIAISNAGLYKDVQSTLQEHTSTLALIDAWLSGMPVGLAFLDTDRRFVRVNNFAAKLTGTPPDSYVGHTLFEVIPAMATQADMMAQRVIATGEPVLNVEFGGLRFPTYEQLRYHVASYYPVRIGNGPVIGVGVAILDVTDARNAQEERIAREKAEETSKAKSELLSRVSHELRTPLNAILGFGQLLKDEELTIDQHNSLDQIMSAGYHLLALINEVLEISRFDQGRITVAPEPTALNDVLKEAVGLVRNIAAKHNVTLITPDLSRNNLYVLADRKRLIQILHNLLNNAVKYNQTAGQVKIAITEPNENQQSIRITVSDTGFGIAPEKLSRLFTPFERLGADQRDIDGVGLGLALSKSLIEAMNGSIGVETMPGQGSNFWIEVPRAQSPGLMNSSATGNKNNGAVASEAKQHSVLYIEDNLSNFTLMKHILSRRPQVDLLTARQGDTGLQLAQLHKPDLILLDMHLPGLSGDEVLARLQADPATASIPIVVISADANPSQIERIRAAGAKAYLTKPLDVRSFLELLDASLEQIKAE